MRILHVVPTYLPATRYGGPLYSVHSLCTALAQRGNEVHVFTTNVDGTKNMAVPLGAPVGMNEVKVWYFQAEVPRRIYRSPMMKEKLASEVESFDCLHLHSIFLWPTLAAACAARRKGVPYVLSPRGMMVKELVRRKSRLAKSLWLKFIEVRNIEQAAALHVTSRVEADDVRRFGYALPDVLCIPNGVGGDFRGIDEGEHSPSAGGIEAAHAPYLLFVGRINWKKGLDRLVRALMHVPDVSLVVAGNDEEGYWPVVRETAAKHRVESRVVYVGPRYGEEKRKLFAGAAITVLPSYSENFGNVVLEAMAEGCPVAVTPEVGASEAVLKYGAGVVVEGEPELFGRELRALLENPERRKEMGRRGREGVRDEYSWAAVADRMEEAYRNIVQGKAAAGSGRWN